MSLGLLLGFSYGARDGIASAEVTAAAVELKVLIEQMREKILNVE
ncbi:DUF1732 domain-containing protein [Shewanella marinintestina]|nr:DUF1732 domain-containing protein [Shewanella marinintestina]MCL1147417.1 DUF1732 domain-containing protein [Shewanella marinintestina]